MKNENSRQSLFLDGRNKRFFVKFRRLMYFFGGCICLVGYLAKFRFPALIPIPFLTVSVCCFALGSRVCGKFIRNNKVLGPILLEWKNGHRMSVQTKCINFVVICLGTCISVYMAETVASITAALIIAGAVCWYILTRPLPEE